MVKRKNIQQLEIVPKAGAMRAVLENRSMYRLNIADMI